MPNTDTPPALTGVQLPEPARFAYAAGGFSITLDGGPIRHYRVKPRPTATAGGLGMDPADGWQGGWAMSVGNCIWVVLFCNGVDEDDRRCAASAVPDQTMTPVRAGSVIADAVAAHAKARELGWSVSVPSGRGKFRDLCPECAERERKAKEETETAA